MRQASHRSPFLTSRILAVVFAAFIFSCQGSKKTSAPPAPTPVPTPVPPPTVSADVTVTNGAVTATGSQVKAHVVTNPNQLTLHGSGVDAQVSVGKTSTQ